MILNTQRVAAFSLPVTATHRVSPFVLTALPLSQPWFPSTSGAGGGGHTT
eukprot:gene10449-biopygen8358